MSTSTVGSGSLATTTSRQDALPPYSGVFTAPVPTRDTYGTSVWTTFSSSTTYYYGSLTTPTNLQPDFSSETASSILVKPATSSAVPSTNSPPGDSGSTGDRGSTLKLSLGLGIPLAAAVVTLLVFIKRYRRYRYFPPAYSTRDQSPSMILLPSAHMLGIEQADGVQTTSRTGLYEMEDQRAELQAAADISDTGAHELDAMR